MGMRFRKSFKLGGGARINLSKSGIGYSFGTKGVRFTKKAGGGTRSTYSLPGTGISYVQESSNRSGRKTRNGSGSRSEAGSGGKIWLWILGWLFIFPLPLTILLLRSRKLKRGIVYGIIAAAWLFFLLIAIGSTGSESGSTSRSAAEPVESTSIIESISLNKADDLTLKIGEKNASGRASITTKKYSSFTEEDLSFVSENPDVAVITFIQKHYSGDLSYEIEAISPGETFVYITSKDGTVSSEKRKVIVPTPVAVESVNLNEIQGDLILGESVQIVANVLPEDAADKTLTWHTSDASVASVDQEGNVLAVGGGTATITAASVNEMSSSVEVNVDGSRRIMNLQVNRTRDDDNNIGDEWSFYTEVNGERTTNSYTVGVGDTINCYAKFSEEDDNPDVGETWASHTVTEEDLLNGFSIPMDLYVTENGGRNSGKSAHFSIIFDFTGR